MGAGRHRPDFRLPPTEGGLNVRALVIDDSRAMRRIVSSILEGLGYEVQQAGHGREGLDVLETGWVPDLVCVDWNMPVMDGLQFVSAVRTNPAWRSMTIMMVTSEREHTQIVRALAPRAPAGTPPRPARLPQGVSL